MLPILREFRDSLDEIMLKAMHNSVLLFGYESYTGRFIKWYAEYYHSIKIDYLVSTDLSRGKAYDVEIFRPSIIDFNYRNVKEAIVWVVEPMTEGIRTFLEARGYKEVPVINGFDGASLFGEKDGPASEKRSQIAVVRRKMFNNPMSQRPLCAGVLYH